MTGGQLMTSTDKVRNISWYTWTCILGNEVNGIWPKYTTINDVNSVDATFKRNLCATGDDFGLVKLFNFPSLKKGLAQIISKYSVVIEPTQLLHKLEFKTGLRND